MEPTGRVKYNYVRFGKILSLGVVFQSENERSTERIHDFDKGIGRVY